jgi:hypothetical protein
MWPMGLGVNFAPEGSGGSSNSTLGMGFKRVFRHLGSAVPYISGWNALDRR